MAFCTNFTSKLSNLHCCKTFYAVCIECFLTNFCWRDRCGSEAWLNFTRIASRSLFLELLIEILSKELIWWQIVERRGLSSKIESFCCGASCGYFCLIARVVRSMRGYLIIRSFVADASLATLRILHSACNFDIVRLNSESCQRISKT